MAAAAAASHPPALPSEAPVFLWPTLPPTRPITRLTLTSIILHHVLVVAVGGGEIHGGRGGPEPEEAEVGVIQLGGAEMIPRGGQSHEGC